MGRHKKDRPRRYKSYIAAYEEALQNEVSLIPESTLRYQRKRKREDSDSSSSSTLHSEHHSNDSESECEILVPISPATSDVANVADDPDPNLHLNRSASFVEEPNHGNRSLSSHSSPDHQSISEGSESEISSEDPSETHVDQEYQPTSPNGSESTSESDWDFEEALLPGGQNSVCGLSKQPDHERTSENEADFDEANFSFMEHHDSGSNFSSQSSSDRQNHENASGSDTNGSSDSHFFNEPHESENYSSHSGSDLQSNESASDSELESDQSIPDAQNNEQFEQPDLPIDAFDKLRRELQGSLKNPLNVNVTLSVGEILTNALTLVKKHNWNHTEKEDLLKFVNSLLGPNIVPNSRYLLDKLFFSKRGMKYVFFCSNCSHELLNVSAETHSEAQVACPNQKCLCVNDLSDLSKASYFVIFDIPSQLKILLDNPQVRSKLVNPSDFTREPEDKILRDLYDGSAYRSFANYVQHKATPGSKIISVSLSVDSAALCTSFSGQSICPCFLMVNELPPVIRMKNLLIGGLWFGLKKEKIDLFLPPIVSHIADLSTRGFSLQFDDEIWHVFVYLIACVADSVARCEIQGIHAHRGDFPCSWCLCEGEEYFGARVFPYESPSPPPRTIQGLLEDARKAVRQRVFVHGVKYLTPLAVAPLFHPIEGFIVDQMHAKDEGTTKSFLQSWLGVDGKMPYYLGKPKIRKVNSVLNTVKIPREFRKKVRSLDVVAYWTGREMENWCLFISLAVLHDILPNIYLKHWALYVQGVYLLLSSGIHQDVVDIAEELLREFCRKTETLYHKHMMRFNLHLLLHFAENCRRWGPMFALAAYQFEAGNQRVKKVIHDCNGVPNQVCRGLSEEKALIILKDTCESDNTCAFSKAIDSKSHATREKIVGKIRLLGVCQPFQPSEEEKFLFSQILVNNTEDCVVYTLLKKDGCYYGPSSSHHKSKCDNSYAKLTDKSIIRIEKIVHSETSNSCWVVGNRVRTSPSPICPVQVVHYDPSLCCQLLVTSIDEDLTLYDVAQLSTVCFTHEHFISAMPNIFNMF